MLSQRSLRLSSLIFILFSLFLSAVVIPTILSSRSLFCSASVVLLLIPFREFLISFIVLFIIVCLLFSPSGSLLNVSCIFSILFPRFWIILTIITLSSFSGRLPISSSFVWSGGLLPCSLICCVFLCLLILLNLLFLGSPFCRLQVLSSHCFWCLPPVAKGGSVCCVGFLVEETGACVLMFRLDLVFLVGRTMSDGGVWGVCDLVFILGRLSASGWGCVPILLVVWHRVSSTGACWSLRGAGS